MSFPFFRGFVLLGFLCLWVNPTEQKLKIKVHPMPIRIKTDFLITLIYEFAGNIRSVDNREDQISTSEGFLGNIRSVTWYQSKQVEPAKLIGGIVTCPSVSALQGPITIPDASFTSDGSLKIPNFQKSYENFYTVLVITDRTVETVTIGLFTDQTTLCILDPVDQPWKCQPV